MKELGREPKRLRRILREASWGEPIRLLTCDFCGWQGSELQADKEFEDNDDCDFEPSGWVLHCQECGSEIGFTTSDPNEPEEWSVDGPWNLKPAAGLARIPKCAPCKRLGHNQFADYLVVGSVIDVDQPRPYRGNVCANHLDLMEQQGANLRVVREYPTGEYDDEGRLADLESEGKRPRKVPAQDPDDPTDSALEYEVNTGFLDPYRGKISTPEGWGPKRGQPAPRLKKKDKSPVMPEDMPIYARRRTMGKLADSVDGLTDEQLAQKFMDALVDELGFIDSWSPETSALRIELEQRDLEVDFWVSLDVMDSEGYPVFQEGA